MFASIKDEYGLSKDSHENEILSQQGVELNTYPQIFSKKKKKKKKRKKEIPMEFMFW